MRFTWLPILTAACLAFGAAAQDPAASDASTVTDGKAAYDALLAEYRKAVTDFRKKASKIYADEGVDAYRRAMKDEPTPSFIPRFQEAAAEYAETPAAIPFLTWLLTADRQPENDTARDALANLVVDHVTSPDLVDALLALQYGVQSVGKADADAALNEILAVNEHDEVKAAALFVRGNAALQDASDEADRNSALVDLRTAVALAPEAKFAKRAEGQIFEAEHLQIGMTAPDIVGEDLDGVGFKLSDYRGKAVLLDFWGDW